MVTAVWVSEAKKSSSGPTIAPQPHCALSSMCEWITFLSSQQQWFHKQSTVCRRRIWSPFEGHMTGWALILSTSLLFQLSYTFRFINFDFSGRHFRPGCLCTNSHDCFVRLSPLSFPISQATLRMECQYKWWQCYTTIRMGGHVLPVSCFSCIDLHVICCLF